MISFHVLVVSTKASNVKDAKYVSVWDTLQVHTQWYSSHKILLRRKSPTYENNNNYTIHKIQILAVKITTIITKDTHQYNVQCHPLSHHNKHQIIPTRH